MTEFSSLDDFSDQLRVVPEPGFSEEDSFLKDLQIVMDENYVNDMFMHLFHREEIFSFHQLLREMLP